jgi:hypothetical protein
VAVTNLLEAPTLGEWVDANKPADNLLWKGGVRDQVIIFWDVYHFVSPRHDTKEWRESIAWRDEHPPRVVSTHRSKSVTLPVVYIPGEQCGLYIRGNFFNWVVSVEAMAPLEDTFLDLIDRNAEVPGIYAEGFHDDWLYESFSANRQRFTTYIGYSTHALWAFAWLLAKQVH